MIILQNLHLVSFLVLLLAVLVCATSSYPPSMSIDTPFYKISLNNISSAEMNSRYIRANQNLVNYFLNNTSSSPFQKDPWMSKMTKDKIPLWERNRASNYDDRVIWSPLMDKFSMPFFSMKFGNSTASATKSASASVASSATFLVASNGALTPSLEGDLCTGYYCPDYSFPFFNRSVALESDIQPEIAFFAYDLFPVNSTSKSPISVFYVGDCVPANISPDILNPNDANWFTTNASTCDSIVVDFDDVPVFGYPVTEGDKDLTGQMQLFRNGTIIFRYLSLPKIQPAPWTDWDVNFDKVQPSCGLINNNGWQVANITEFCRDATSRTNMSLQTGTPLYNEIIFTRNVDTDANDCHSFTSCDECTSSSSSPPKNNNNGCVWCEGSVPQKPSNTAELLNKKVTSGRCVPKNIAISICGAFPYLAVENLQQQQQQIIPGSQPSCSAMKLNYALLQLPYRSFYYSSGSKNGDEDAEAQYELEEWRQGMWATGNAEHRSRNDVGASTFLPRYHGNVDTEMIIKGQIDPNFTSIVDSVYTSVDGVFKKLTENQFLPSQWWNDNSGRCQQFVASGAQGILSCSKWDGLGDLFRLYAFSNVVHLAAQNLTIIETSGKTFSPSPQQPSTTPTTPSLEYCIRRKCRDQPENGALKMSGKCPPGNASLLEYCDGFSMATWRGVAVPSLYGEYTYQLAIVVGEFGHIFAHLELYSPLGNLVPNVLPKSVEHFFMIYEGGTYSAPMRRWGGSGITVGFAPVDTCPATCPIGRGCDPVAGACVCSPQYDIATFCTRCKDNFVSWLMTTKFSTGTIWNDTNTTTTSTTTTSGGGGSAADQTVTRCVPCPSKCYNGGVCDNATGACLCPSSNLFDGPLCDIDCQKVFANYSNVTTSTTKSICNSYPYSSWICGRCITRVDTNTPAPTPMPTPAPPVPEVPLAIGVLGFALAAAVALTCVYVIHRERRSICGTSCDNEDEEERDARGNHANQAYDDENDDNSFGDNTTRNRRLAAAAAARRRRRQKRIMQEQARRRKNEKRHQMRQSNNNNNNNDGEQRLLDDDDEDEEMNSDPEFSSTSSSTGGRRHHTNDDSEDDDDYDLTVDDHLQDLPPKLRIQILTQKLKSFPLQVRTDWKNGVRNSSTKQIAKWEMRLHDARKLDRTKSNPLGIAASSLRSLAPPPPPQPPSTTQTPLASILDRYKNKSNGEENEEDYNPPQIPSQRNQRDAVVDDDDDEAFVLPPVTVRIIQQSAPGVIEQQKMEENASGMRVENSTSYENEKKNRKTLKSKKNVDDDDDDGDEDGNEDSKRRSEADSFFGSDRKVSTNRVVVKANPLAESDKSKNSNETVHLATLL